jgi:hypothetical protein
MRRWFLSYTSQDFALTQALKVALKRRDPDADIFFAPESMRAGGFWKKQLAEEIEGPRPSSCSLARKDWASGKSLRGARPPRQGAKLPG